MSAAQFIFLIVALILVRLRLILCESRRSNSNLKFKEGVSSTMEIGTRFSELQKEYQARIVRLEVRFMTRYSKQMDKSYHSLMIRMPHTLVMKGKSSNSHQVGG